jgi:hypothetical protein
MRKAEPNAPALRESSEFKGAPFSLSLERPA